MNRIPFHCLSFFISLAFSLQSLSATMDENNAIFQQFLLKSKQRRRKRAFYFEEEDNFFEEDVQQNDMENHIAALAGVLFEGEGKIVLWLCKNISEQIYLSFRPAT